MKPLSILTFLLLALTSYSQNSQVFNKKILYTPEEEGYEIEVALKYKFSSSPDGLDCYMELVTEHIEVENSRYLYKDKWYTINDLEFAEDKVLFREKINTRIDVIANAFEGESNLGEVSLPNLLADWGVPSTVITDYSIVMNALTLRNIKIVNTNTKHMSGLDYRIQKQISRGEVNEVLQRARAAEERGDLEKALSLYQSILVSGNGHNHYSGGWSESCSNDLKISIRENISRLKKLTKKSNRIFYRYTLIISFI